MSENKERDAAIVKACDRYETFQEIGIEVWNASRKQAIDDFVRLFQERGDRNGWDIQGGLKAERAVIAVAKGMKSE